MPLAAAAAVATLAAVAWTVSCWLARRPGWPGDLDGQTTWLARRRDESS